MSIKKLVAEYKGNPNNSSGKDIASTVNALIDYIETPPVIWLGIDSLTENAGGFTYNRVLEKLARGVVGWGGRWIPFSDVTPWGEFSIYKQGINDLSALPYTDVRRQRSLDGRGFFTTAGADCIFLLSPTFGWDYADVYYLQNTGGGSFNIDRPTGQTTVNVNTNGSLSIQRVRITKNIRNGTATENNSIRIQSNPVGASFTVYGVMFYSGDDGPRYVNVAQGGRKITDQLLLDQSFQQQWFSMLGVTHAVLNAGMNDRTTSDASQFKTNVTALLNRFPVDTKIIIQRPNDPTDNLIAQYNSVYTELAEQFGATYIDTLSLFGNYAAFNSRGWMLDGVHPNQHYQIRQAQEVCKALFGKCRYENTPPVINYTGGDTQ
jgi:hypothetical protein